MQEGKLDGIPGEPALLPPFRHGASSRTPEDTAGKAELTGLLVVKVRHAPLEPLLVAP
jgi:hypothetical protein